MENYYYCPFYYLHAEYYNYIPDVSPVSRVYSVTAIYNL